MAENSKIQWTDHTFNPWRGCSKIAPGCANCYAERQSVRDPKMRGIWGKDGTRVVASDSTWADPGKWNRKAACTCGGGFRGSHSPYCPQANRPRVFCASLSDVFEEWGGEVLDHKGRAHYTKDGDPTTVVTSEQMRGCLSDGYHDTTLDDCRARLFRLIDSTPNLDWLLLTKRPENIRRMWPAYFPGGYIAEAGSMNQEGPRSNCWLGTSIACQEDADKNIPALLKCRELSPLLFLSIEPLIEEVRLDRIQGPKCGLFASALHGQHDGRFYQLEGAPVDWVIVGGESGPNARPCSVNWIWSIVRQCKGAGVPCFVKQLGAFPIDSGADGVDEADVRAMPDFYRLASVTDPKGGDPSEWPEDLRVREFPVVTQ